jgi:hypothetical protein
MGKSPPHGLHPWACSSSELVSEVMNRRNLKGLFGGGGGGSAHHRPLLLKWLHCVFTWQPLLLGGSFSM